jgi:hypothetical protein
MDQLTPVLLDPLTVAVNVVDCPPVSVAAEGDTETETGVDATSDIAAVSLLVLSAVLVAFTVTVCADVTLAGAA